ncbi:protein of unknown function [Paenibacillus sp. cl130]|nr:protein of unknown function [Paenibacillus sp. cl130]
MNELIHKLVRKYRTNCPFDIAKALGIHIRYCDLGPTTKGLYYHKLRRRFIVIHNGLTPEWERFVCAHELDMTDCIKALAAFLWRSTPTFPQENLNSRPIGLPCFC